MKKNLFLLSLFLFWSITFVSASVSTFLLHWDCKLSQNKEHIACLSDYWLNKKQQDVTVNNVSVLPKWDALAWEFRDVRMYGVLNDGRAVYSLTIGKGLTSALPRRLIVWDYISESYKEEYVVITSDSYVAMLQDTTQATIVHNDIVKVIPQPGLMQSYVALSEDGKNIAYSFHTQDKDWKSSIRFYRNDSLLWLKDNEQIYNVSLLDAIVEYSVPKDILSSSIPPVVNEKGETLYTRQVWSKIVLMKDTQELGTYAYIRSAWFFANGTKRYALVSDILVDWYLKWQQLVIDWNVVHSAESIRVVFSPESETYIALVWSEKTGKIWKGDTLYANLPYGTDNSLFEDIFIAMTIDGSHVYNSIKIPTSEEENFAFDTVYVDNKKIADSVVGMTPVSDFYMNNEDFQTMLVHSTSLMFQLKQSDSPISYREQNPDAVVTKSLFYNDKDVTSSFVDSDSLINFAENLGVYTTQNDKTKSFYTVDWDILFTFPWKTMDGQYPATLDMKDTMYLSPWDYYTSYQDEDTLVYHVQYMMPYLPVDKSTLQYVSTPTTLILTEDSWLQSVLAKYTQATQESLQKLLLEHTTPEFDITPAITKRINTLAKDIVTNKDYVKVLQALDKIATKTTDKKKLMLIERLNETIWEVLWWAILE